MPSGYKPDPSVTPGNRPTAVRGTVPAPKPGLSENAGPRK